MLNFNIDVNSPTQTGFVSDFSVAGNSSVAEYFSQDSDMDLWIRPVAENADNAFVPWVDDYVAGDVYYLSIGNVDDRPTGGTFTVAFLATSNPLAYNISAANLQTQLNAKSVDDGYGSLTVTMLVSGVYQVDWIDVGAVPAMTGNSSQLIPASQVLITQVRAGGASERAQQIIDLRQSPVATSTLTTAYVPTGVDIEVITAPSLTTNAVWSVAFNDVYDGYLLLYITANGVESNVQVKPNMSEQEFGVAIALHPEIFYQDAVEPDNISVKLVAGAYLITFIGTLAGSATFRTISAITAATPAVVTTTAAHGYVSGDTVIISGSNSTPSVDGTRIITVLSATTFSVPVNTTGAGTAGTCYTTSQPFQDADDTNCITPKGLTGSLNLNTFALAKAFWNTTEDALTYSLQIKRTRASGEIKTIFGNDVTLKRELIDIGTLIDVPETGLLSLTLGRASVQNGELILANYEDGDTVTIKVNTISNPWTLTLPSSAGTNGQALITNGSGVSSWATLAIAGGGTGATTVAAAQTALSVPGYSTAQSLTAAQMQLLAQNSGLIDPKLFFIREDFAGGNFSTGNIGECGLTLFNQSGTLSIGVEQGQFPNLGQCKMTTGATLGNGGAVSLDYGGNAGNCFPDIAQPGWDICFIIALADINCTVRIGFINSPNYAYNVAPNRGLYFRYSPGSLGDTHWMRVSNVGGVETATSTGVAPSTAFIKLRIRMVTAGTALFSVNGGAETSVTTTMPGSSSAAPRCLFYSATAGAKTLYWDYLSVIATTTR